MKKKNKHISTEPQEPGMGQLLLNILKIVFLIAVLVAFWVLFDRLLGNK